MGVQIIYLLSLFVLFDISILVLRVIVRKDYMRRGTLSIRSAFLQALVFFVYGGFPSIYLPDDWPVSQVNLPLRVIGLASLFIGLVIMFIGIYRLGIIRSLGMQSDELKKSSYYQVTRNPQVLGCVLYIIGFIILWPSWYAVGWGLSLLVILHVMVLTEEEHLRNLHGQDYELYRNNVHRYLGYPNKSAQDKS